jgi:hypothetical protein
LSGAEVKKYASRYEMAREKSAYLEPARFALPDRRSEGAAEIPESHFAERRRKAPSYLIGTVAALAEPLGKRPQQHPSISAPRAAMHAR